MSCRTRSRALGPEALGGACLVAALLVLLGRWLPLRVAFEPDARGIVSATVLEGHPPAQELLWFVLAAALGVAGLWALAALLEHRRPSVGPGAGPTAVFEAGSLAALAAALFLARELATLLALALAAALLAVAVRRPPSAPSADPSPSLRPAWSARWWAVWGVALLVLAVLRTPRLLGAARLVAHAVPDAQLAGDDWVFQVEVGQHLAWADALARGLLHGRDFYCLYGPLYDWLGVAFWQLFSRSIRAWHLYWGVAEVAGLVAVALLASALVRRRGLALLAPLLVVVVDLRLGIPLLGLFCAVQGLRSDRGAWWAGAGGAGGLGLLYSQEYGLAFACCAAVGLVVRRSPRAAGLFAAGLAVAVTPLAVVYARADALAPMLRDLAGYPGLVMAGYGNLPFPSLRERLPLRDLLAPSRDEASARLGYLVPALCAAALALALPRPRRTGRGPVGILRAGLDALAADPRRHGLLLVGLFGLLAFRSALGRSDSGHIHAVLAPAAVLVVAGLDRLLDDLGPGRRALAAGRALAAAGLLVAGGLLPVALGTDRYYAGVSAQHLQGALAGAPPPARGSPEVRRVSAWIREHSGADDPVLFLPNNAAYYYLTGRPNPTRFVVSHQIPSDAHRAEFLADLRRHPPRFVVWDDAALRIDGVSDEHVLGEATLRWLAAHYAPATRIGSVRILRRADPEKDAGG